jgi:hypothetical protein
MKVDSWFSYIALTRRLLRNDRIWTWPGNRVDPEARGLARLTRDAVVLASPANRLDLRFAAVTQQSTYCSIQHRRAIAG